MEEAKGRTFSLCRLTGLCGVVFVIVGSIFVGGGAMAFIHLPSLGFTCGIAFFLLLASFGTDFLRFIPDSVVTWFCSNSEPNPRFAEIALSGSRYVIGAGVTGTLIGMIQML